MSFITISFIYCRYRIDKQSVMPDFEMKCSRYIQHTVSNQTMTLMKTYIEKMCQLASISKFQTDGKLLPRYLNSRTKLMSSIYNLDKSYLSSNDSTNENETINNITQFPYLEMKNDNCSASRYELNVLNYFKDWWFWKISRK